MHAYLSQAMRKEALDLNILSTDLLALSPHRQYFYGELARVATNLEACGMFQKAAHIFGQVAQCADEAYKEDHRQERPIQSKLPEAVWRKVANLRHQGLAFLSCGEMHDAEEILLCALRILFGALGFNQSCEEGVFGPVMKNLDELYRAWVNALPDGEAAQELNEVAHLLRAAILASYVLLGDRTQALDCIADKFGRSPKTIKSALKQAFLSDSVASFHATVRSWKRSNIMIPIERHPEFDSNTIARIDAQDAARRKQKLQVIGGGTQAYCGNPICETQTEKTQLLQCKCHSICYW
jgi:tetratricopeptide (TPR) repeat protein